MPLGDVIYVASPGKSRPFDKCGEIRKGADGIFRLTEDNGIGRYGEAVDFTFASDGSLERVSLGGLPLLREAAFRDLATRVSATAQRRPS